ncbi:MAG TPA: hypothetical protein VLQ65_14475, partial [Saliniramus sp.]|nr:hypothetical protein [Saliniramus sp.]
RSDTLDAAFAAPEPKGEKRKFTRSSVINRSAVWTARGAGGRDALVLFHDGEHGDPQPPFTQPYRWLTFAGFLRNLSDLDDAWRWRFMSRIMGMREGFPQETWDRCARHPNFHLHAGAECSEAMVIDAQVRLLTSSGPFAADFVICGTGIENDFAARPELSRFADNIATWNDRYEPPPEERNARLGRFPYLGPDYAFLEREPGATPWIKDIHLFSIASTMSFGPSGSSINAMTIAVPKLVSGVTGGLFAADIEKHWRSLQEYDVPQAVLRK